MTSQKELIPLRPGDILRYEREQKGLSRELASRQSRIKLSVIEAIESGETHQIPSVYLRGYIRNYARFLGVNPDELEEQMANVEGAEPDVKSVFTVQSSRGPGEKWLKASSYLVASALIATLAWQFTHEAIRFSQGDAQRAPAAVAPAAGSETGEQPQTTVSPGTHLNASIASVEVLKQRGEAPGDSPAEQAWAALGRPEGTVEDALVEHSLLVKTSADTWVEILDASGAQMEMDLIRAGSRREYLGRAPFSIMIGRASAVELALDGEAVDLGPYTRGNVARMTLGTQ
jgi:cytoskeleton protein RodZ